MGVFLVAEPNKGTAKLVSFNRNTICVKLESAGAFSVSVVDSNGNVVCLFNENQGRQGMNSISWNGLLIPDGLGYALPSVTVPSNSKSQCFEWKQFKQPDLDKEHEVISGEEAAKHVEKIIIHFQTQPNEEFDGFELFEIIAIGTNRDE